MRLDTIAIAAIISTSTLTEVQALAPHRETFLSRCEMIQANRNHHHYGHMGQGCKTALSSSSALFSVIEDNRKEFENEGSFSWMRPYLGVFGYTEGKSSVYAIPMSNTDNVVKLSDEEILQRQRDAAENMFNIGPEERERRAEAANIFRVVTIVYAIVSSLFLDQGDSLGHLARFGILLPTFFTVGFQKSAELGL